MCQTIPVVDRDGYSIKNEIPTRRGRGRRKEEEEKREGKKREREKAFGDCWRVAKLAAHGRSQRVKGGKEKESEKSC